MKGDILRESGSLRSSAIMWSGFIFGDTGIIDFVDLMKRKAKKMYENPNTRDFAINKLKIVSRDGIPLDTRDQVNFKDNPNIGQPLKGHSYSRTMYGVAGKGRQMEEIKFFTLNFNDDVAKEDKPYEFYKMYMFRGTVGKTDLNMHKINAKSVTKFDPSPNGDLSWDEKANLILNSGYKIWKVSDIEKAFGMNKDPKNDDRTNQSYPLLIRCIAREIEYSVNDQGNRKMEVDDEEMWGGSYTVWIPEHLPLDFGLDTKVLLAGNIMKGVFNEQVQYNINAEGIFPLPNYFQRN